MSNKRKAQFYVFYLGWKECRGIRGREFVEPIVRELIDRRYKEELPKLTIEATRKELKIMQLIEKKKNKVEKLKYPPIPTKDVTYAVQALSPDEDVVACIYLGYNPQTRAAVHVHVYRCDSPATASMFVEHLSSFINQPDHADRTAKIEQELVAKGQVLPSPSPYALHAMEAPPGARHSPYGDQRHYGSRDNMSQFGGSSVSQDNLRDAYNRPQQDYSRADYRDNNNVRDFGRDTRDYTQYPPNQHVHRQLPPPPREDPYSLRDFRRELNDARSEPRNHFRNVEQPGYDYNRNAKPDPRSGGYHGGGGGGAGGYHQAENQRPSDHYHEQEDVYQSVTAELKAKLQGRAGGAGASTGPLLLPAKDYDTVKRKGLEGIEERRSRNKQIVGYGGGGGAGESGDDRSNYSNGSANNYRSSYPGNASYDSQPNVNAYGQWRDQRSKSPEYHRRGGGGGGRPVSPEPRGRPGEQRRGRSPVRGAGGQGMMAYGDGRMARAMSPPPSGHELRNNYFPSDDVLPNYLPGGGGGGGGYGGSYAPARAASPSAGRRSPRATSPHRGANRYTASNLGLKQGAPPPRSGAAGPPTRPRSDEGYLSMDNDRGNDNNPYRGYSKDPYGERGDPRGGYGGPRDDSPPPREVIAGDTMHPELGDIDESLPGSSQPFLY